MSSRDKGKRGEREIVAFYREQGFDSRRTAPLQAAGFCDAADVSGVAGLHIEVKRQEALNIWKALEQAERDAPEGVVPSVHFRRNRSEWYVALRLEDFVRLVPPEGLVGSSDPITNGKEGRDD
jgi:Holliday junction resolvase